MEPVRYAGFWWRWLAAFIDGLILQFAGCFIGIILWIAFAGSLAATGSFNAEGLKPMESVVDIAGSVLGLLMAWFYFAVLESSELQATPGKLICKLKVTDTNGERLTFARASGRYWGKILSSFTCCIGYVMMVFMERKQTLHDLLASTLVIKKVG